MASASRTALLRQSQLMLASKHLSSSRAISTALRHTPSILSRQCRSSILFAVPRFAPFSTSTQNNIMPPGPQVIEGDVNDPAPVPKPSPIHGSYHWTFERALSIGLVPLTIAPFAAGSISPAIDAALIFTLIVHSHIGFQSCITDYFSVRKHPALRKFFDWLLNICTLLVAIGFYEFETNDVGITEAIKRIWHAGANDATVGKADLNALGHDGNLKHLKE